MPNIGDGVLPKRVFPRPAAGIRVSPLLLATAACETAAVCQKLQTAPGGLTQQEALRRLQEYGPNVVAQEHHYGRLKLLAKACVNPLVILLLLLAAVSSATELLHEPPRDFRAAIVMALMVVLGVSFASSRRRGPTPPPPSSRP